MESHSGSVSVVIVGTGLFTWHEHIKRDGANLPKSVKGTLREKPTISPLRCLQGRVGDGIPPSRLRRPHLVQIQVPPRFPRRFGTD